MSALIAALIVIIMIGLHLLVTYRPFIDITCKGDVLLWYDHYSKNRGTVRKYKFLFKIKK